MMTSVKIIVFGLLTCYCAAAADSEGIPLERVGAMLEVARMVEQQIGGTVDLMELIENGGGEMNDQLDRYSRLMGSDAYRLERSRLTGEFAGLGVVIRREYAGVRVLSLIEDGPAQKADVQPQDLILKVGNVDLQGMSQAEVLQALRGPVGSRAVLVMRRGAVELEIVVKRGIVELPSVEKGVVSEAGEGSVRITQFHQHTRQQLSEELNRMKDAGMTALTLDLRGNPGGSIDGAVETVSLFLEPGQLITTAKTKGEKDVRIKAERLPSRFHKLPLAVLVDGGTASAAEIVAGCLQDHKRAEIMGTRTFGKGIGQRMVRLPDGSALKLTTTTYFTPNGNPIHGVGIILSSQNNNGASR